MAHRKPPDHPDFEVLSAAEVRERYRVQGFVPEDVEFNEADVPDSLKHLTPWARIWGIGDDVLRDDMIDAADPADLKVLKRLVADLDDEFDSWLTSPAAVTEPSAAYFAFTNLRMVAYAVTE